MPVIPHEQCQAHNVHGTRVTPKMLCAGYMDGRSDACQVSPLGSKGKGNRGMSLATAYCQVWDCVIGQKFNPVHCQSGSSPYLINFPPVYEKQRCLGYLHSQILQ